MNFLLVGNPNSGKTTLFNTLCRTNQKVANWHGVTVEVAEQNIVFDGKNATIFDLPGLYSLSTKSLEEKISKDFLFSHKDDIIINICSYETFERNIFLTYELLKNGFKVVLFINTVGGKFEQSEIEKMKQNFGIEIFQFDARKSRKNILNKFFESKPKTSSIQNLTFEELVALIPKQKTKKNIFIDKILFNKFFGTLIFVAIITLIFYLTFGRVGSWLEAVFSKLISSLFFKIEIFLLQTDYAWFSGMYDFVIMKGFLSVVSFIPKLVLLLTFLWILEEIGYLPRIAYLFNDYLCRYNLSGRSIFTLIMGMGCTTTAVITSRNMENKKLRDRTSTFLPFISCSAKLPIFVCISSLFFQQYKVLLSIFVYLFGIVIGLIVLRILPKNKQNTSFILEIPSFKFPSVTRISREVWRTCKEFFVRVGFIVIVLSIFVWTFQNINFQLQIVENIEDSILVKVCKAISVLFIPLGFGNWQSIVALISGFIAKESVYVSLVMLDGFVYFNTASSLSFLIFVLLYSPCLAAMVSFGREFGAKRSIFTIIFQTVLAYIIAFIIYSAFNIFEIKIAILYFLLIILAYFLIKKLYNKKCVDCKVCKIE